MHSLCGSFLASLFFSSWEAWGFVSGRNVTLAFASTGGCLFLSGSGLGNLGPAVSGLLCIVSFYLTLQGPSHPQSPCTNVLHCCHTPHQDAFYFFFKWVFFVIPCCKILVTFHCCTLGSGREGMLRGRNGESKKGDFLVLFSFFSLVGPLMFLSSSDPCWPHLGRTPSPGHCAAHLPIHIL